MIREFIAFCVMLYLVFLVAAYIILLRRGR